jgi:hypothetical protein
VKKRRFSVVLWIAAFILTVVLAVFQRMTGPSYPLRGSFELPDGGEQSYSLPRTHGGAGGLEVVVELPASVPGGTLEWRRYPTDEPWRSQELVGDGDGSWSAEIPHQPPAGKVEYRLSLAGGDLTITAPEGDPAVARFRADVPAWVLIPHILAMFGSMLVATRSLLEVLRPATLGPRAMVLTAMGLLVVGGLFLGPVVQKFAFDAYWTGWPNGADLTDNKTLIAVIAWLPATILALKRKRLRVAVVAGWIVMMGVFLIPHSLRGSEMDWSEGEIKTGGGAVTAVTAAPV